MGRLRCSKSKCCNKAEEKRGDKNTAYGHERNMEGGKMRMMRTCGGCFEEASGKLRGRLAKFVGNGGISFTKPTKFTIISLCFALQTDGKIMP